MPRAHPAWTFYGRQGCGCCEEAANLLLLLLVGHRITVRMIDLVGPHEAPTPIHRLPALMDGTGHVVWQGAFDSRATELAWEATARGIPTVTGNRQQPRQQPQRQPSGPRRAEAVASPSVTQATGKLANPA